MEQTGPWGEIGYVVLTSLDNFAFPFVRYRNGDRAALAKEPCSCGRGFRLLKNVEGRSGDFVTTPEGLKIHSEFFSHIFWELPNVRQFQVRQETLSEIEILIVIGEKVHLSMQEKSHILSILRKRLGQEMEIRIEVVDSISSPTSGKLRYVVSEV